MGVVKGHLPLRAVPDPEPEHPLIGALSWIHRLNGAVKIQRDAKHFISEAEKAGNPEQELAFREVYAAAGRAREAARP
jgi:hypothetical protein